MDICGHVEYYRDVWHFGEMKGTFFSSDTSNNSIISVRHPGDSLPEVEENTIDAQKTT